MARLWWRRLRIPIYCIIIVMLMRLLWYSLFSESNLDSKEWNVDERQNLKIERSDNEDWNSIQNKEFERILDIAVNERFEPVKDYEKYANKMEESEDALSHKYLSDNRKSISKPSKQSTTSSKVPEMLVHDIQLQPPKFKPRIKANKIEKQVEDLEVLEDNSRADNLEGNSRELYPSIALELEKKDEMLHSEHNIRLQNIGESKHPALIDNTTRTNEMELNDSEPPLYSEEAIKEPINMGKPSEHKDHIYLEKSIEVEEVVLPKETVTTEDIFKYENNTGSETPVVNGELGILKQPVTFLQQPTVSQESSNSERLEQAGQNEKLTKLEQTVDLKNSVQTGKQNNLGQSHDLLQSTYTGKPTKQAKQVVNVEQLVHAKNLTILEQPVNSVKSDRSEKLVITNVIISNKTVEEFPQSEKPVTLKEPGSVKKNIGTSNKPAKELKNPEQLKNYKPDNQSVNRSSLPTQHVIYKPLWKSLDSRPLPLWYDRAKFGIFIHWGVFSVPSYSSEKFWWQWKGPKPDQSVIQFMKNHYPENFTYSNFANNFTAEFFNATEWALLFQESGAQYVILTSKHHEGYTLWPSKKSKNWNSQDVGPHRDLVGLLAKAVRSTSNLKFGLYYSLFEWFHHLYIEDKQNAFQSTKFVDEKVLPELLDIVSRYAPDIIWADGDFAPTRYWKSKAFLAWLYNKSKVKDTVVTNDRWGDEAHCKHGGYILCSDHYQPDGLERRKWEMCASMDKLSWGYRRDAVVKELLSTQEILTLLVTTVSKGGNLLLNVGATKEGVIPPVFQERLSEIGTWLKVNGEGIYGSRPWRVQNDSLATDVWYTFNNETIYAFITTPPKNNMIELGSPIGFESSKVYLLGWDNVGIPWNFSTNRKTNGIKVAVPTECWMSDSCKWIMTLKLVNFE